MVAYEEHAAVNSMLLICNQKWAPQVSTLLNRGIIGVSVFVRPEEEIYGSNS
jgi:hypothetical protein